MTIHVFDAKSEKSLNGKTVVNSIFAWNITSIIFVALCIISSFRTIKCLFVCPKRYSTYIAARVLKF